MTRDCAIGLKGNRLLTYAGPDLESVTVQPSGVLEVRHMDGGVVSYSPAYWEFLEMEDPA